MAIHADATSEEIHTPIRWLFANAAARNAVTFNDLEVADVRKLAIDLDTSTVTILTDIGSGSSSPVWTSFATSLSNLDATNLTSGTIPDARFPATLPAIDGSQLTGLPPPSTLYSATEGSLDGSGVCAISVSGAVSVVACWGSQIGGGQIYVVSAGGSAWNIRSSNGGTDSGKTVNWIAF